MNSENEYMGPRENEEIHFADYIRVIRKRLTLFLVIFVMVTAAGVTYTFMSTPVYQAEIKIEILDSPEAEISLLSSLSIMTSSTIDTRVSRSSGRMASGRVEENGRNPRGSRMTSIRDHEAANLVPMPGPSLHSAAGS